MDGFRFVLAQEEELYRCCLSRFEVQAHLTELRELFHDVVRIDVDVFTLRGKILNSLVRVLHLFCVVELAHIACASKLRCGPAELGASTASPTACALVGTSFRIPWRVLSLEVDQVVGHISWGLLEQVSPATLIEEVIGLKRGVVSENLIIHILRAHFHK